MTDQEINEAVARKLGWNVEHFVKNGIDYGMIIEKPENAGGDQYKSMPDYCHSIKAAWEILEKLDEPVSIYRASDMSDPFLRFWHCDIGPQRHIRSQADTAPKAICLAFLKLP